MRRVALAVGLALALAGCGKYGPPVRTPEKSAATSAATTPYDAANSEEDRKESKK